MQVKQEKKDGGGGGSFNKSLVTVPSTIDTSDKFLLSGWVTQERSLLKGFRRKVKEAFLFL